MKLKTWGRRLLATAVSAGLGFGSLSCATSNTVDYLYLLSARNNPGQVNVYDVDSQTGFLYQIPDSPYPAGRNPVGIAMAPSGLNLYVVNHDDNTIIDYGIGTDAKLYPQHTYTTPGSEPVAVGMNAAGTLLFVLDYYAPLYTDLNPGNGALVVYPIGTDGSLGTSGNGIPVAQTLPNGQSASYYPVQNTPTAIDVLANGSAVYVADLFPGSGAGGSGGQGALEGLSVSSGGVVAPVAGSPYAVGVTPSALGGAPSSGYLYVADSTQNLLRTFPINGDGSLATARVASTSTGSFPVAMSFDATGKYLYVANRNANNIQGYVITAGTGLPVSNGTYATDPYPQCVIVDPNLNRYVYTADFQGHGSTGFQLDPGTGVLSGTEKSPYTGTGQATCLAATIHNKSGQGKGTA